MARWPRGEATIERLLAAGDLDAIDRSASDGGPLLAQAQRRLKIAEAALDIDTDGAYTNAYDAARLAATALLTQQGLRPTTRVAIERWMRRYSPSSARGSPSSV